MLFYTVRFELDSSVKEACQTLSTYLQDSTLVQTKQLVNIHIHNWYNICTNQ